MQHQTKAAHHCQDSRRHSSDCNQYFATYAAQSVNFEGNIVESVVAASSPKFLTWTLGQQFQHLSAGDFKFPGTLWDGMVRMEKLVIYTFTKLLDDSHAGTQALIYWLAFQNHKDLLSTWDGHLHSIFRRAWMENDRKGKGCVGPVSVPIMKYLMMDNL